MGTPATIKVNPAELQHAHGVSAGFNNVGQAYVMLHGDDGAPFAYAAMTPDQAQEFLADFARAFAGQSAICQFGMPANGSPV